MEEEPLEPKSRQPKLWLKVLLHLGIMAVVAVVVGWLAMLWLDVWTHHGETVEVPDIKGLSYEQACAKLEDMELTPVLSDSIYDTDSRPGQVLEQNPKVGTTVKPGREIYLTIHAFHPQMVTLPPLTDVSVRQARSMLEGLGITNISERRVESEYQDLVLSVSSNGKFLAPGARIPITSSITLTVGETPQDVPETQETDSLDAPEAVDESELLDLY